MSIDWFQGDNFGPTFHLAQAKTIGPVETNPVRCSPNYIWFIWILNYDLYETQTIIETTTQTMLSSTRTGRRALQTETLSTRTRTGCTGCTTEEKVVLSMIPSRNRSASPALEEVPSWPLWLFEDCVSILSLTETTSSPQKVPTCCSSREIDTRTSPTQTGHGRWLQQGPQWEQAGSNLQSQPQAARRRVPCSWVGTSSALRAMSSARLRRTLTSGSFSRRAVRTSSRAKMEPVSRWRGGGTSYCILF